MRAVRRWTPADLATVKGARKDAAPAGPASVRALTHATYPLIALCRVHGIVEPIPEFYFHPTRKWRADYAWPSQMLLLECDGGLWTQGRHSRGSGRLADMEKLSEAAILGYRVLYTTPGEVENGAVLARIRRALNVPEAAFR